MGVLSLQPSVFKDSLNFQSSTGGQSGSQNGAGMEPDLYEGLPLVKLVDEKGEDLVCLLRAVCCLRTPVRVHTLFIVVLFVLTL